MNILAIARSTATAKRSLNWVGLIWTRPLELLTEEAAYRQRHLLDDSAASLFMFISVVVKSLCFPVSIAIVFYFEVIALHFHWLRGSYFKFKLIDR